MKYIFTPDMIDKDQYVESIKKEITEELSKIG